MSRQRIIVRARLHFPPDPRHHASARRPKFNTTARPRCAARLPGDSMCRYELLNTLIAYLNDRFFSPPIHFDF